MRRANALRAAMVLALSGCDRQAPEAESAMTRVETSPMAVISYVEVPVSDMDRAVAFYEAVFGLALERATIDGYEMALFPEPDGGGASAALAKGDVYKPSVEGAIVYFRVPDIDAVLARATAVGGDILYAKKDIGENGWVAEIKDSEGNRIALNQVRG